MPRAAFHLEGLLLLAKGKEFLYCFFLQCQHCSSAVSKCVCNGWQLVRRSRTPDTLDLSKHMLWCAHFLTFLAGGFLHYSWLKRTWWRTSRAGRCLATTTHLWRMAASPPHLPLIPQTCPGDPAGRQPLALWEINCVASVWAGLGWGFVVDDVFSISRLEVFLTNGFSCPESCIAAPRQYKSLATVLMLWWWNLDLLRACTALQPFPWKAQKAR